MFQDRYPIDYRKKYASKILNSYRDKLPVILEDTGNGPNTNSVRLVVTREDKIVNFMIKCRKYFRKLNDESLAVFLLVLSKGDLRTPIIPSQHETFDCIYEKHKCEDNILYIALKYENCFGGYENMNSCIICNICFDKLMSTCPDKNCMGNKQGICVKCLRLNSRDNGTSIRCPKCNKIKVRKNKECIIA